jgi:hypothetical protein
MLPDRLYIIIKRIEQHIGAAQLLQCLQVAVYLVESAFTKPALVVRE